MTQNALIIYSKNTLTFIIKKIQKKVLYVIWGDEKFINPKMFFKFYIKFLKTKKIIFLFLSNTHFFFIYKPIIYNVYIKLYVP